VKIDDAVDSIHQELKDRMRELVCKSSAIMARETPIQILSVAAYLGRFSHGGKVQRWYQNDCSGQRLSQQGFF
jgi:hypothetical protein